MSAYSFRLVAWNTYIGNMPRKISAMSTPVDYIARSSVCAVCDERVVYYTVC